MKSELLTTGLIIALTCFVKPSYLSGSSRSCLTSMSVIDCNSSNSNTSCGHDSEICVQPKGSISHCYALYLNETDRGVQILKMGCWLKDLDVCSLNSRCEGSPRKAFLKEKRIVYFCCCTGDNCNGHLVGRGHNVILKNKSSLVNKEGNIFHEQPKSNLQKKLKNTVLVVSAALAGSVVVMATSMCVCRYLLSHRTRDRLEKTANANPPWSTLESSETSSVSCCNTTVAPENFQLIKCLLKSRLGEIWIARIPPSEKEIKIKICPDSLVYIYEGLNPRHFPLQNV